MKALMMFDLNNVQAVEEMIKQAAARYTGDATHLSNLKEALAKVKTYLPGQLQTITDRCQTLVERAHRYCVSFYNPDTDAYLETAAHYTEQINAWVDRAQSSIQSVRSLYQRFKTSGINLKMLSSPVEKFASRNTLQRVLFLVLFPDACTHIRNVLEVVKAWLKADENLAVYVKNDLRELERLKEDKVSELRDCRQRSHGLTYKLSQMEAEYSRLAPEVSGLREREGGLRIEEVQLVNSITDTEREIEVKERRRELLRRVTPGDVTAPSPEPLADTLDSLNYDLKSLREKQPPLDRQLAAVRLKLTWIEHKMAAVDRLSTDMMAARRELKQVDASRLRRDAEFSEVERAVCVARRVLMCKTASDSVEKLHYKVNVTARAKVRLARSRDDGDVSDPVERACAIIAKRVGRDWAGLYRVLPFHPLRGSETISRDIVELSKCGARDAHCLVARRALDRWRRYHTRSSVEDLKQALRNIRRLDILKVVDLVLKPPKPVKVITAPFEVVEEPSPPVAEHLVPYYKLIERYDQTKASRMAAEAEAERRKQARRPAAVSL